jgi:4-alpha-glucanotransferase
MDLFGVHTNWFPQITYIAEDLGNLTDDVHPLRDPRPAGIRSEFAFSGPDNAYLPHHYTNQNCVCFTGTHDNDTALGWYAGPPTRKGLVKTYLGRRTARAPGGPAARRTDQYGRAVRGPDAGLPGLGGEARSTCRAWPRQLALRMASGAATAELAKEIRALTAAASRCLRT